MMAQSVLFDTNILIDYLNGIAQAKNTLEKFSHKPAISVITWMEVMVSAKKMPQEQETRTRQFLAQFLLLPVTDEVSERAVIIRHETKIKLPDAIVWATAQVNARTLISRNPKDFAPESGVIVPYQL
ncbi:MULTISPECIES: type II toxin-antitoxin system VapC family toxin [Brenneria]|uniref:Type II toxin-antitoxin system VapC family toxin n=1 Tax=Brenneria nigrifluens DSM 30175 = ATCC 13028 TaxID=1121120 RepID=A0A2U1UNX2_9GAMM|nr:MULTISPECIES: type II toxin-antitoxin system VapC family toxin [Brenneria]EHD23395.1 PilT protein domain protein [Brenneria sp. EniD312]PWC23327.1 type II toxin-antitoxin system VapC family toxin [Brenneria nigrifluens DSM 30175 = ATCC 13028]QCR06324.1 type II toxin-antitoxin system VapC family toxin [Brenneria nigrifluens DSM 30175 = ATCC 13028]